MELHYPSHDVPAQDSLKMQLSYDNEKFTSEWIMLNDGRGHQLDMIMAVFVYSNSEIHEVTHRLQYKQVGPNDPPGHSDRVTIAYHWIKEVEEDTRSGLNFLFVAGCLLTGLSVLAVAMDSADLSATRSCALGVVPRGWRRTPAPSTQHPLLLRHNAVGRRPSPPAVAVSSLPTPRTRPGGDNPDTTPPPPPPTPPLSPLTRTLRSSFPSSFPRSFLADAHTT